MLDNDNVTTVAFSIFIVFELKLLIARGLQVFAKTKLYNPVFKPAWVLLALVIFSLQAHTIMKSLLL